MEQNKLPQTIIITGMSGAGKSRAIEVFEDLGYNCADNIPPSLITKFIEICRGPGANFTRLCIVVDCRIGELFETLYGELHTLKERGLSYRMLFLDASDEVLKRRYKETRRRHPLENAAGGSISAAIQAERKILQRAKEEADIVVDTSLSTVKTLRELISKKFSGMNHNMSVTIMSFGFKHGPQSDADMLFDVRCLPNPYYLADLRPLTGLDDAVYDYVFQWQESRELFDKLKDYVCYTLPLFSSEGRSSINIAFGCTGGQHRSVSFARKLSEVIEELGYNVTTIHRDIEK
ncbi:MAG: RNase adapter RapZ [Clostridia bacterium]|nr:RNase adapter RapZ [Clostridia bacterium]